MKFGVLIFPGSNCDHDAYWTIQQVAKQAVTFLWHESHDLENCDAIIVPGGFAYGDYLRTGAIARFSPVMESVRKFAESGGIVLGICNGFQILCESGLLPGALTRNIGLKYVCKPVYVRVENTDSLFDPGRPDYFGSQSQWIAREHCGYLQPWRQCSRYDAPPGARRRTRAWRDGRVQSVPV